MKQQIDYIISQLRGYYPDSELRELAYWIIEESTGLTRSQILTACKDTKKNIYVQGNAQFHCHDIEIILQKLRAQVPIQYIFGHTEWMGFDLRVTPATLIPRPETAELVEWILSACDTKKPLQVLDIGTGSGCIAIALKKRAPLWQVTGIDISAEALTVAKENATRNQLEVNWKQLDILNDTISPVDIIVSNPPYICEKERITMDKRVLEYEPSTALFVPNEDPLRFYRRIATQKAAPMLFFEINEAYGQEVCELLDTLGYTNIQLKNDIYGKQRMVFATITI